MLNSRYTKVLAVVVICLSLPIGACISQGTIPTQTQIVIPSHLPSTTQLPTLTPTSTLIAAQQATQEARNSLIATNEAMIATDSAALPQCGTALGREFSPNGDWVAIECINYGMGVYNLKDASKAWFFSYYDVFGKRENGFNTGKLRPKHWSSDGRYLYFTPFLGGDGGCVMYNEGQALFRLDTSSGEYSEILAPPEDPSDYNFTFSNDDTYIGSIEAWRQHPTLKLHNVISGAQQEIALGEQYSGAGYVIWAPDNTNIFFSARSGEECDSMTYYLILMNLKDRNQTVILQGQQVETYQPIRWLDENQVIVAEWFSQTYYSLDLVTGEILPYDESKTGASP